MTARDETAPKVINIVNEHDKEMAANNQDSIGPG